MSREDLSEAQSILLAGRAWVEEWLEEGIEGIDADQLLAARAALNPPIAPRAPAAPPAAAKPAPQATSAPPAPSAPRAAAPEQPESNEERHNSDCTATTDRTETLNFTPCPLPL